MADAIQLLINALEANKRSADNNAEPVHIPIVLFVNALLEMEGIAGPVTGNQAPGTVFAGPLTGPPAVPAFRALASADIAPAVGGMLANKNRILNGGFRVSQYNGDTAVTPTASAYVIDRWKAQLPQASKLTFQRLDAPGVGPGRGSQYAEQVTTASAYAILPTDSFVFLQPVEGLNVEDFRWGTPGAQTVSLSFAAISSIAGNFGGAIQSGDVTRSFTFEYNIPTPNTWYNFVITIPGDQAGSYATGPGLALYVEFGLGVGANFQTAPGVWTAGNFESVPGAVSLLATAGATWAVTNIQLEIAPPGASYAAPLATEFEWILYPTELAACQRYYQQFNATQFIYMVGLGMAVSSTVAYWQKSFPVTMRAPPTFSSSAGQWNAQDGATALSASLSVNDSEVDGISLDLTVAGGFTAGHAITLQQAAPNPGGFLAFSAEL